MADWLDKTELFTAAAGSWNGSAWVPAGSGPYTLHLDVSGTWNAGFVPTAVRFTFTGAEAEGLSCYVRDSGENTLNDTTQLWTGFDVDSDLTLGVLDIADIICIAGDAFTVTKIEFYGEDVAMARYVYTAVLRDEKGDVISGATVAVYLADGTTAADVYEAESGGSAVASVESDANGRFTFYVDDSDYEYSQEFKIVATKTGYTTITLDDIKVFGVTAASAALAKVTPAANKLPYFTSGTAADVCDITAAARTILDDATVTAMLETLIASSAQGDLLARGASAWARMAKGTALQTLQMNSGATGQEWAASPQSVLTAGGDILYASAANTLARLAKGTANQRLYMNAGATAPEWGSFLKMGAGSHDVSVTGDQAITSVGFKPSLVIILCGVAGAAKQSIGFDSASVNYCVYNNNAIVGSAWELDNSYSMHLVSGAGVEALAKITSMDADGFTLTWAKNGSPTGTATILYIALR